MARKTTSGTAVSDINVTPMVDIMLVLLIIFMVITPMLQGKISVDLAKTQNPKEMADAEKEDAVTLAITRDGKIFLGSNLVTNDEITAKVKDMVASKADKTVYLKSDSRAKYGDVVKVVDNVRAAGVESIGLLTEKLQQKGPAVPATP